MMKKEKLIYDKVKDALRMTKEDHEFRVMINKKVKLEIEKTELEIGKEIRMLRENGWLQDAIRDRILLRTIERLLK